MARFILLFSFFFAYVAFADTTTVTVLKSGKLGGDLRDIDFATANVGYAVGDDINIGTNNFIAKTTNGGLSWQRIQTTLLTTRPWVVEFQNADTGFVGGYTGMLLRTTNGGTSWASVNGSGYTGNFQDIQFATPLLGWACGTNGGGTVIQTTDGGITWTLVSVGNTTTRYSIVAFSTSEVVISGSSGSVVRTTDAGATWGTSSAGTGTLYSLARVGVNGLIVTGSSRTIYKSTNRGATFTPVVSTGGAGLSLYSVWMADSLNGFTVGSNGLNYRTLDGWATIDSVQPDAFTAQVCRTTVAKSATEILVGADQGNILRSTDFGTSWSTVESSTRYYALDFLNASTGVAVGWRGTVIKTTNGGTTWTELRGLNGFELYDVKMFDINTFYACGGAGRFYVTTNGGTSFVERTLPVVNAGSAKTLHFLNPQTGFCAGEMGRIYRTSNAGITWDSVYSFGTSFNNIEDIAFDDDSTGYAVGERGRIARTTNSVSWDSTGIVRPAIITLWEAQWIGPSLGYVTGQNGTIYKTTNGGASWSLQNDTTGLANRDIIDIQVVNPTRRGYAVGENGVLLKLVNPNSWTVDRTITMPFGTPENLWGIRFVDTSRAFVCGYYGTIYRLDVTTTTSIATEIQPTGFALEQNFPNPFNPSTTIRFTIPVSGVTKLEVFDVTGRTVVTLANQYLAAGSYKSVFEASRFASGVYFYKLTTGKFVQSKKMLLTK